MRLCLGPRAFHVGTRALVVSLVDPAGGAVTDADGDLDVHRLLAVGRRLVADGADILDVVDPSVPEDSASADRVVAAVEALAGLDVAVSVTTSSATVAADALAVGATLVGDRRPSAGDLHLAAARAGAGVMVVAERPQPARSGAESVDAAFTSLEAGVAAAMAAGVAPERIVVDGGLDRGGTPEQFLALLRASGRLAALGPPVALSATAADVVRALPGTRPDLEMEAGVAAACVGVALGCRLVRTTDVRGVRRACDAIAAVLEAR